MISISKYVFRQVCPRFGTFVEIYNIAYQNTLKLRSENHKVYEEKLKLEEENLRLISENLDINGEKLQLEKEN